MVESRTQGHTPTEQRAQSATSPAIDRQDLHAFVGEWHTSGNQFEGAIGSAERITATQTYEWLQGDSFLIHRFDGTVGRSPASCIEIIGYDTESGECQAHTYYNNGRVNIWDVERDDERWVLCGDWNMAGRQMKVRCTVTFAADGGTMHSLWEHSSDGRKWTAFWDLTARKATSH